MKNRYIDSLEYQKDRGELFLSAEELIADLKKHRYVKST